VPVQLFVQPALCILKKKQAKSFLIPKNVMDAKFAYPPAPSGQWKLIYYNFLMTLKFLGINYSRKLE